jgi:hypothetical protein
MPSKGNFKTIADIYLMYPYRCWDVTGKTIPVPYVPKDEIVCDHKYSLTYKEFKKIVMTYLKYLKKYLLTGVEYKMPQQMGYLQFVKFKSPAVDYGHFHRNNKEIRFYLNKHSQGYRPKLIWKRGGNDARLKHRWSWRMRPCRGFKTLIHKSIISDPAFFFRLNNS